MEVKFLKIYICEDNKEQRERFYKIIKDIIVIKNYDMEIGLVSSSPQELLKKIEEDKSIGIYFLDVDLKNEINGIKLAEKIREFDKNGFIIFITTHSEMSYLTFLYKVEALDYILKDNYNNINERIGQCLDIINNKYTVNPENEKGYSIKVDDRIINVNIDDILFFETSPSIHRVILHCKNMQVEFYEKMKNIEKEFESEGFCRCHTSFIVNIKNIKEIDKKNRVIVMKNGETCLVSIRGLKKILEYC